MNNRTFNSSREDTIVKHNLKPKTANVSFLIKVISYILDAYFILFVSLVILSIIIRSVGLNIVSSNSVILNYLLVSNFLFYSILFKNNQSFSERLLNIKYIKSKSYLPFFTFFYSAHKS